MNVHARCLGCVALASMLSGGACDNERRAPTTNGDEQRPAGEPLPASQSAAPSAKVLSLGVVPQQSAAKLARLWRPIIERVNERTGLTLRFATAPDISTFEQRLAAGEYDVAYMNPYHYTVFSRSPGYRAFAKERDKQLRGIVVVAKDSPIAALSELHGQTVAFPSPAAFAATILPRAHFREQQWHITPAYVTSHDSVYRAVADGLYPAGGGVARTLRTMGSSMRDQLRVLWKTQSYSPHAFAAHPRVAQEHVAALRDAFSAMDDTPAGVSLLRTLGFKGLVAARNDHWDDVRGLEIDLLDGLIESGH